MDSAACIVPVFNSLTREEIDKINDSSFIVAHRKGEKIFGQGKPISYLMYLNSGLVKIFEENEPKKSVILKIVGPGHMLGLFTTFHSSRYDFSATALEDSELIYLSLPLINEIIQENGKFGSQIIQLFAEDVMALLRKMVHFPQKQVPGRMAEILLFFAQNVYFRDDYTLPLSRQEIADFVYSTKESVSRTLTEFKNDRLIEIDDRKITLKSIELLRILSKLG
jgi:CRP/FNR family transcriptional regulator, polysaccharide utilization system transcription regulator